jgi:hypothetical protein
MRNVGRYLPVYKPQQSTRRLLPLVGIKDLP